MTERPLEGVRVVVARPRDQADSLVEALEALGATAVPVPVIEIVDPVDEGAALRSHLAALRDGDWLVISSPNGATMVARGLEGITMGPGVSVAAIGPGTKKRAEALGLAVDLVPEISIAEGMLDALPPPGADGGTILLARAEAARALLPEGLRRRGWTVHDVAAYRTVGVPVPASDMETCRHSDVVAFTSSSTVRHLHEGVGPMNLPPIAACIGPATAETAQELGITIDVVAREHTVPGLVDAIAGCVRDLVLLRPERADSADAHWLLEQYFAEIDERLEGGLQRDGMMTTEVDEISPPAGLFIVARHGGHPVGCGVLKLVEPDVADIKRMWVSDSMRGHGLGRRLLLRLVAEAEALGLRRVQLETNEALVEAIALYRSNGFVEVEAFNDEPNAHLWFARDFS